MAINIQGKTNLLSGFYQDIIINKSKDNNIIIKARTDEKNPIDKLDKEYNHLDLSNTTNIELFNNIVDYYLDNNTIQTIFLNGKLKNYRGSFLGLNTWADVIDGHFPLTRALLINNDILKESIMEKIDSKYYLDLSKSTEKILSKKFINIDMSDFFVCHLFKNNDANIVLMGEHSYNYKSDNKLKAQDEEFLLCLMKYIFESSPTSFYYIEDSIYFINEYYRVTINNRVPLRKLIELYYTYKNADKINKQITLDDYVRTR